MFLGYQQVTVGDTVLTVASFTIPVGANHVMLQAEAQNVRYTMDNTSAPDTGVGMVLIVGLAPELFSIEDFRRIKLHRGAGSDGKINVHYSGGRSI